MNENQLRDVKRYLENQKTRPACFRGVPLSEFNRDELEKIAAETIKRLRLANYARW